ncbi:MAG TPA: cell division/cell wall cluster transcriptional repressor MraZ [Firmicutes bacterium]|nr:cell division/cell wall cluster transcriptional repressor MraZ [Bacillota bacterium]
MLLFGKYEHQMDEKKRIRIPAKLKDALGANPVIMKGTSPCLVVYSSERASEVIKAKFEKIIDGTVTDEDEMDLLRDLTSNTQNAEEDKQGRVKIEKDLVDYARLKKDIVTIGVYDKVEIWSAEEWNKRQKAKSEKNK